ncbi:DMT family transporter [Pseudolysinimonas sp.]|uniref:DMT family transporter n=1 Tax=Pseudolysinimonas sp. TaxID=2680009 RepID=UPI003F7F66AF
MGDATADPPVRPRRVTAAAVVGAVAVGAAIATQTRINAELGARLHDGFAAAVISFGSGLVLVLAVSLALPSGRRGLAALAAAFRTRRIPWWYGLGGAAGAAFVLGQGILGAALGVALFTVGIVAGQTVSSLLIDRRGLGTLAARRITPQRLLGAALAVAAVVVTGLGDLRTDVPVALVLVPLGIGLLVGAQPALNGQLRVTAGSAATATTVNFLVGTLILLVAALVHTGVAGWPVELPSAPWLYLGGVVGVAFIAAQTVIVRVLGVLLMGLAVLAGQLAAAVVFDLVAPVQGRVLAPVTVVGAAVTLVAVAVAAIPGRRVRGTSGTGRR